MARRGSTALLVALAFAAGLAVGRSGGGSPSTPAAGTSSQSAGTATVTKVSDGDTVWLSGVGKVRLIGIDTPEVFGRSPGCFGREASAFADRMLHPGTRVRYRVGRESHDRYGRTLAYIWLHDGRMFNQLLAADGYARPLTIAPNDDYAKLFAAAARRARDARKGLWGSCPPS
jgi:micrococcal nuclease